MSRFRARFEKQFGEQLDDFDGKQSMQDAYFRELFDFIGVVVPKTPVGSSSRKSAGGTQKQSKTTSR